MRLDKPISSKGFMQYQLVRIGNVEIVFCKGEPVAFEAPGFGVLGSAAQVGSTLGNRALEAFSVAPTALITGGTPFLDCLTHALMAAFHRETPFQYNKDWFETYRKDYQSLYYEEVT